MSAAPNSKISANPVHAAAKLAESPAKQLVAELLERLRSSSLSWWTPADLRTAFPAKERLKWLEEESALRGHLTNVLTGLFPNAALAKSSQLQAELIDAAIDGGDTTVQAFENAFEPHVLATHGAEARYWRTFRKQLPWESNGKAEQKIVAFLIEQLLGDVKLSSYQRRPILTPLDVRRAIDARVWTRHIPEELRAKIDSSRMDAEAKGRPFGAAEELALVPPALLVQHVPIADLRGILDRAEEALGFGRERAPNGEPPKKDRPRLAELAGASRVSQSTPELSFDFEEEGEAAELDVVPSVN
jgi:hypothetical protein